jgi:hypothetical protein
MDTNALSGILLVWCVFIWVYVGRRHSKRSRVDRRYTQPRLRG